ncbi:hypothetical protein J7T55_013634 [Diaporthe amygdali]|uniref:uncharacterized protein n=1 Tax=Phomopsis amygdali TaxID=1214568 RepID=UPI0022FE25B4|nr:uncharacterized protein J7T55_013634 [Diaporthe amygdali]KAJ0119433.1 hypothetical protein J7T55_013634 [Diaporthe amygdali]
MSTAATQQQPPAIPPRPSRGSQDRERSELPKIPPRPIKRGPSPNPDRYAPSPLNGGLLSPTKKDQRSNSNGDPIDRSRSVDLPAVVGEEGMEYAALAEELASSREPSTSPTQTRAVDENMKIYAPTATMPASRAKQRIMQVTRTDSDNAAAFGIGKPSQDGATPSNRSLKKKASTASGEGHSEIEDEEHGIPEIGQQIPLLKHAGDVQAPSPAPGSDAAKAHKRKGSSRGLPPGSYGLHGHNVAPQDKLDKEYYQKHPELLRREHHPYQADRPTDFALSSEQLNKLVRETESTGHGVGTDEHMGGPSEQAGWAALDASSRPQSAKPGEKEVHIEEPNRRRSILLSGDPVPAPLPEEGTEYTAPILAEDEVRKNTPQRDQVACIEPSRERRGSDYEADPPRSRPTSRPASLYKVDSSDLKSTPLEDVEEYEPLFPEDDDGAPNKHLTAAQIEKIKQRFPSKDIWEDAPSSVHHTATVSTPDLTEQIQRSIPPRDQTETPAQEWARKQEELAEKELTHPDAFLWRNQKPTWVGHQPHLAQEAAQAGPRPKMAQKFPSRDIWEDTPDSLKLETTVSGPQQEPASPADNKPHIPERPLRKSSDSKEKPSIPERPKNKSPEETSKPQIPDRPKPQIPARPTKASAPTAASTDAPAPKAKPAVPARPAGNKIAALQAGFMSDLNKKLGLGPRPSQPKEEAKDEVPEEPKEKAPLSDARKGRARGPQRRAPAAATAAATAPSDSAVKKPKLSFSTTVTVWSLDPDSEGTIQVGGLSPVEEKQQPSVPAVEASTEKSAPAIEASTEDKPELEEAKAPSSSESESKLEEDADAVVEEKEEEEPKTIKQETLATNMAGESVEEATIEEDKAGKIEAKHADVNPVED